MEKEHASAQEAAKRMYSLTCLKLVRRGGALQVSFNGLSGERESRYSVPETGDMVVREVILILVVSVI